MISHPELNPDGPSRLGPLLDLLSIVSLSLFLLFLLLVRLLFYFIPTALYRRSRGTIDPSLSRSI